MKNKLIIIVCLLLSSVAWGKETTIDSSQLPEKAGAYLKAHFSAEKIAKAIEDKESDHVEYEVRLENGTEVEFRGDGSLKSIDGNRNALPDSTVPENILKYVKEKYPERKIVGLEEKHHGYEVELKGDIELKFNKKGEFLRVDD